MLGRFHCCKRGWFPSFPHTGSNVWLFLQNGYQAQKENQEKHHWPPESGTFSTFLAQTRNGRVTRTPQAAQPSHQTHTFSSSIAQAKRFKWKQLLLSSVCLQRLRTKTLSISKYELKQSGISELWLVTRRAWNHFLVLTDHYPPCPLHHCRRDTEQVLSWDASSSSVTEHVCMHAHVCSRARLGGAWDRFKVTLYFQHKTYNFN